jgi:glyoxylase-like metal-dependent hydrolase (beta-lactamase superfamily II)
MSVRGLGSTVGLAVRLALLLIVGSWTVADAQPRAIYQQTQYQGQEIGRLTGDVYYARMDDYVSVFMVTPDGIVLVEPISSEFATWLKGELATRFKVPVKYVIYSHHHWDHASGASMWADTARIVGHEAMVKRLAMPPADTPLPQSARAQDTNGNGTIEAAEAEGTVKAQFALYDANRDNVLSGAEVTRGPLAFVRPPDLTFTGPITITLGGKRVEVLPRPNLHADDNTIVRFVDGTGVLFASDWITSGRVPFGGDVAVKDELELAKAVRGLDFEHFVCSHGRLGTKADVESNITYREELRDAVAKAIAGGLTLEQAQASVTMDAYKSWEFYQQQRPGNVAGTYRALQAGK